MAIETVRTYEVEVKGANSVKELKQEISDLRDKLVKLDKDSEAYSKTVEDLIADETKLTEVMRAGKNEVSAATGSYNALVQEMSALKKVWREVTSESERAKIGERIREINDQLKEMDASIGNNQRKVGSYEDALKSVFMSPRQQISMLRKELAGLTVGTKEYNEVFNKLAQLTMEQKKLAENLAFSSAHLGDILGNVAGVARGVVGGFSAMNAAMGIFGDGNEDMQEAMLKTQRMIAIVQGLEGLQGLSDRIKGLFTGIKNFVRGFNGGAAALGEFEKRAGAASAGAAEATTSINAQTTSINQAAVATERMSKAVQEFIPWGEEEIQQAYNTNNVYQAQIQEREETIALLQEEMALKQAEGNTVAVNALETEIKAQQRYVKVLKSKIQTNEYNITQGGKTTKIIKVQDTATKSLTKDTTSLAGAEGAAAAGGVAAAAGTTLWAKALGVLKTALIATGIGAIIVALGSLLALLGKGISWIWGWISGANKWKKAADDLKTANEELTKQIEDENDATDFQVRKMEAAGAAYEEVYEVKKKNTAEHLKLVAAQLADAEAAWATISPKKQQKKKYAEFREELEKLRQTYADLQKEMVKIDQDKIVHDIQIQTNAENERRRAAQDAAKEKQRQLEQEKKKAEDLYKSLTEYYKDEKTKLKEKYEQEKALLEKYGLDTVNLTRKYEQEKTKIVQQELKARYDYFREYNARQDALLDQSSEEYYTNEVEKAKEMMEDINEIVTMDAGGATVKGEDRDWFNAKYGLNLKTTQDFVQQVDIATNAVERAEDALLKFKSTKSMEEITKQAEGMAAATEQATNTLALKYEEMATKSTTFIKGFYSGLSPKELRQQIEETYTIQSEGLQAQVDMYRKALEEKTLADEDRAAVLQQISDLEMQMGDLQTQHIIDQNNLVIESYNNMVDSIQSIASSLTDILGSVADMMIDNAERAYEAGDITKEAYEQQFEDAKKVQIAQAIINTIAGALGAFMGITKDTGGWGIAAAAAEAAAILTAGFIQVDQIRKTKPSSSGGSSSGTTYAVAIPKVEDYNPQAVVNATGESETENLANALSATPLKAYVVESDITDAQNKARTRKDESTF